MERTCGGCGGRFTRDHFTKNQWRKGEGDSRCTLCVKEIVKVGSGVATERENHATKAVYGDLDRPWASGSFRWVQKGIYTGGMRTGQECVVKWFKKEDQIGIEFFETELAVVDKAMEIIQAWNEYGRVKEKIRLNRPDIWRFKPSQGPSAAGRIGQYHMVEPFIADFRKFNSNTGWRDRDIGWPEVMQALSHWSYHQSGGQYLLCDLQGGIDGYGAILTDPVVASQTAGQFGPTDLGPKGISTFFSQHKCNEYCRDHWLRPIDQRAYHKVSAGTSMESSTGIGGSGSIAAMNKAKMMKPARGKNPTKVPSHQVGSAELPSAGAGGGGWSSFLSDPRWETGIAEEDEDEDEDDDDGYY